MAGIRRVGYMLSYKSKPHSKSIISTPTNSLSLNIKKPPSSMANHHLLFLLLVTTITSTTSPPPNSPTPPPQSIQDLLQIHHQQQLNNIIDALIGAGDFTSWANILSSTVPTFLPLSATLFIPSDHDFSSPPLPTTDPLILPYHIVPQRLTFAQLHQLRPFSRLPTLLSNNSILVTNTSLSNFTLDGSCLSHPDLYTTNSFSVHGIARLLDYSLYGDPHKVEVVAPPPPPSVLSPPREKKPLVVPEGGEMIRGHVQRSSTAERCFGGCVFWVLIGFAVSRWVM